MSNQTTPQATQLDKAIAAAIYTIIFVILAITFTQTYKLLRPNSLGAAPEGAAEVNEIAAAAKAINAANSYEIYTIEDIWYIEYSIDRDAYTISSELIGEYAMVESLPEAMRIVANLSAVQPLATLREELGRMPVQTEVFNRTIQLYDLHYSGW